VNSQRVKLQSKIYDEYKQVQVLPYPLLKRQKEQLEKKKAKGGSNVSSSTSAAESITDSGVEKILDTMPKKAHQQQALVMHKPTIHNPFPDAPGGGSSLVRRPVAQAVRPEWHAPWRLMRVISGHQGWVRSIAVEPGNNWFATGAGDRIIKVSFMRGYVCDCMDQYSWGIHILNYAIICIGEHDPRSGIWRQES
jgi:pleiotropic regulator 1